MELAGSINSDDMVKGRATGFTLSAFEASRLECW